MSRKFDFDDGPSRPSVARAPGTPTADTWPLEPGYVDFKGWRFRAPFRCIQCGRRISVEQFCYARACGPCDCNTSPNRPERMCISGPRELINPSNEYFITEDRWLSPVGGLYYHPHDGICDEAAWRARLNTPQAKLRMIPHSGVRPVCILDYDSPSYPPTDDERRQCGCLVCLSDLYL